MGGFEHGSQVIAAAVVLLPSSCQAPPEFIILEHVLFHHSQVTFSTSTRSSQPAGHPTTTEAETTNDGTSGERSDSLRCHMTLVLRGKATARKGSEATLT